MRNPTRRDSTARIWWESEREDGASILAAMLCRSWWSARLFGASGGHAARYRNVLGRLLRAGVRRPPGIRAGCNRRRIGLAAVRDFSERRGGAHAAYAGDRIHLRCDQPLSNR